MTLVCDGTGLYINPQSPCRISKDEECLVSAMAAGALCIRFELGPNIHAGEQV